MAISKGFRLTAIMFHSVVFILQLSSVLGVNTLRGVAPSKLGMYQGQDTFRCLHDRVRIGIDRVNDDVCDCVDGSDEPGAGKPIPACAIQHC